LLKRNDTLIAKLVSEHIPVGRRNLVRPRERRTYRSPQRRKSLGCFIHYC